VEFVGKERGNFSVGPNKMFGIEVKKEEDFVDTGAILRQIKGYRIFEDRIKYCILSTKIPDDKKKVFEGEGILCLEIKD
jgi:hypothetical protein